MITENSLLQPAGLESAGISSIKQQMLNNLQISKEYRHSFVEEAIRTRITAQIHTLRTKNRWDYKTFAEKLHKKVSWAYRLEDPNEAPPTIPTLLAIAEAFDIGLDVRFRPFSELLKDVTTLRPTSFAVRSFEAELNANAFSGPGEGGRSYTDWGRSLVTPEVKKVTQNSMAAGLAATGFIEAFWRNRLLFVHDEPKKMVIEQIAPVLNPSAEISPQVDNLQLVA